MELEFEFRQKIIRLTPPKSLATCMDFVSVWSSQIPRSQFSRLCAGAIAVSAPSGSGLPRYDIALGDPVAFGHGALDTLLSSGGIVRLGLSISQKWGKNPFWFDSLEKNVQISLIADYRLNLSESKKQDKRKILNEKIQKERRRLGKT